MFTSKGIPTPSVKRRCQIEYTGSMVMFGNGSGILERHHRLTLSAWRSTWRFAWRLTLDARCGYALRYLYPLEAISLSLSLLSDVNRPYKNIWKYLSKVLWQTFWESHNHRKWIVSGNGNRLNTPSDVIKNGSFTNLALCGINLVFTCKVIRLRMQPT